ncbi:hypothetical protein F4779DRAFT_601333 [Xylariaceae sp. FL0662B]|nr:hypothetical protein F4779DRAFT_601333 [Xylariaceae sp. FL0662B]
MGDHSEFKDRGCSPEGLRDMTDIINSGPETAQTRRQKRTRTAPSYPNTARSKRQLCQLTTPSSSPFQTLKVIKSSNGDDNVSLSKAAYRPSDFLYDAAQGQDTGSEHLLGQTTMEQLTPYPTSSPRSSANVSHYNPVIQISDVDAEVHPAAIQPSVPATVACTPEIVHDSLIVSCGTSPTDMVVEQTVNSRSEVILPNARDVDAGFNSDDEYPLDGVMEEDMVGLFSTAQEVHHETNIPPSSITLAWDHDSRSAAEYDPALQYSSPFPSSGQTRSTPTTNKPKEAQEDLLDDDVDWDAVYEMTNTLPKDPSIAVLQEIEGPSRAIEGTQDENLIENSAHVNDSTPLRPFARVPFPEKVRDRSVVPGLCSKTVLRTCFRIGETINQAVRCSNHQQDVVFELYARVTYSSRESLARKQHFQFVDLFTDRQPYPAAVLSGWRVGSQLDRQSSVFLNTKAGPRLCRSLCRPRRDPKAAIGWTFVILDIRETDWEQISWAKKIVCGDDSSSQPHGQVAAAKL